VTAPSGAGLAVRAAPAFREVVAFTPQNRQAVALEPYTCTTDAINLQPRGVDAGLLVLPPGGSWSGVVEFAVSGPGS
jgi:aldose 1-epimerase